MKKVIFVIILVIGALLVTGGLVCYVYNWFAPQVCPDAVEMPLSVGVATVVVISCFTNGYSHKS